MGENGEKQEMLREDKEKIKKKKNEKKKKEKINDPDVIRTRNLLIWSQTRYRCATESL